MGKVINASSKEMQEELKIAKQLSRIDSMVFKVVEDYAKLQPGESLTVPVWGDLTPNQVYGKLYFVRAKVAPKVIQSELLAEEEYLQQIMNSFLEWKQSQFDDHLVLRKPGGSPCKKEKPEEVKDSLEVSHIRGLFKAMGKQVKQIEKEREAEARGAVLMSIQEEMEDSGLEEESSNLELPPSAGKDTGSDDWLAGLLNGR